jgi:Trm5-related predicted tRNA methylase
MSKKDYEREEMRKFWKERKKQRKEVNNIFKANTVCEISAENKEEIILKRNERKKISKEKQLECCKVVLDFSYCNLQTVKELTSMRTQVSMVYGASNKKNSPLQLHFTSFCGSFIEGFKKLNGFTSWNVLKHENHFLECFDKNNVIYLTSDSPNILETVENDKIYIIGCMVDHNRLKV